MVPVSAGPKGGGQVVPPYRAPQTKNYTITNTTLSIKYKHNNIVPVDSNTEILKSAIFNLHKQLIL